MKDYTELVIIIDKSGSMSPLRDDVIGGYNTLIEEQKKEGNVQVTTVFFNHEIDFIHESADIDSIKSIDGRSYAPSGCTALLDAIGDSIAFIKNKHAKLKIEELPKNVIFSIMTDGLENSSREYSYSQIKKMINLQEKSGWVFLFQAANIDVEHEAERLGVKKENAMSFDADSEGIIKQMCCANIMINKSKKK